MIASRELSAVILCGGQSRRFGGDKALALLAGRTFLERVIEAAGARADELVLAVGPVARYEGYGLPLALDPPGADGPLAGMAAGVARATRPYVLLVAVDLPHLVPAAIDRLAAALVAPSDYVLPRTERGLEPLLAMGRRAPLHAALQRLLASPGAAAHDLARELSGLEIVLPGRPDAGSADPLLRSLVNVNEPGDLPAAGRRAPADPPA